MTRRPDKPTGHNLHTECLHYATMGYSRTDAAAILGYSRSHFTRAVLPRIDPGGDIPWPSRGWSVAHREAVRERRGRCQRWRARIAEAARRRPRVDTSERDREMRRLYAEGWLQREIGAAFGMCQQSVSRVLRGGG